MAMILYERGLIDLDAPITGVYPSLARMIRAALKSHSACSWRTVGSAAYEKLFLRASQGEP